MIYQKKSKITANNQNIVIDWNAKYFDPLAEQLKKNYNLLKKEYKHENSSRFRLNLCLYGCGTCEVVCPANAIKIKTKEGQYFPEIDMENVFIVRDVFIYARRKKIIDKPKTCFPTLFMIKV